MRAFILALLLALAVVAPARADTTPPPQPPHQAWVSGFVGWHLEVDTERATFTTPNNRVIAYAKAVLALTVREPGGPLSLDFMASMKPVRNPPGDFYFETEAAFVERLYLTWHGHDVRVIAGKYEPAFSMAHLRPAGLFGNDVSDAYRLAERIGFGTEWTFVNDKAWGRHALSIDLFTQDISPLSRGVFNQPTPNAPTTMRPRSRHVGDGGLGNTGRPDSVLVGVTGRDAFGVAGLSYGLSFARQAPGIDGGGDEWRSSASLRWLGQVAPGVTFDTMVEWVRLRRPEQQTRFDFVTVGATVLFDGWTLALLATLVPQSRAGAPSTVDTMVTAGLSRKLFEIGGGQVFADFGVKQEILGVGDRLTVGTGFGWFRRF